MLGAIDGVVIIYGIFNRSSKNGCHVPYTYIYMCSYVFTPKETSPFSPDSEPGRGPSNPPPLDLLTCTSKHHSGTLVMCAWSQNHCHVNIKLAGSDGLKNNKKHTCFSKKEHIIWLKKPCSPIFLGHKLYNWDIPQFWTRTQMMLPFWHPFIMVTMGSSNVAVLWIRNGETMRKQPYMVIVHKPEIKWDT